MSIFKKKTSVTENQLKMPKNCKPVTEEEMKLGDTPKHISRNEKLSHQLTKLNVPTLDKE